MPHDAAFDPLFAPSSATPGDDVELRVFVSTRRGQGWHARVIGPGEARRDFVSPFELARFVAWPYGARPSSALDRLR